MFVKTSDIRQQQEEQAKQQYSAQAHCRFAHHHLDTKADFIPLYIRTRVAI